MLGLEADKRSAQAKADYQLAVSTALWRMDSWLAPQLAQEAVRPYFEYKAYYPNQKAYNRLLGEIGPGEVLSPSPLLTFRSEFFPLHFQIGADNELTSPQVPVGNYNDLAQADNGAEFPISPKVQLLEKFRQEIQLDHVRILGCNVSLTEATKLDTKFLPSPNPDRSMQQQIIPRNELASRNAVSGFAKNFYNAGSNVGPANQIGVAAGTVDVGPLLPVWSTTTGESRLLYLRRVRVHNDVLVQGILTDWPQLRTALLEQIADLFPLGTANLVRTSATADGSEVRTLATLPAILESQPLTTEPFKAWSATHSVLIVAWVGLLVSLLATGFTMRSTLQLGERRARFASAVTHELRTPLTTFRMYSEMLADDMVEDPAQRKRYLETLKGESDRLSRLVENVLSYSRLEEGRYNTHPERVSIQGLLDRVIPVLERRTNDANLELHTEIQNGTHLDVDVDAVTQILFNLVDNACKYAADGKRIELFATAEIGKVRLTIRDHGLGISQQHRAHVFKPFERGGIDAGDNESPGVGLGLALARGLARDLGGDLLLAAESGEGAAFTLEIPISS